MKNTPFIYIGASILMVAGWIIFVMIPSQRDKLLLDVKFSDANRQLDDYKRTLEQLPEIIFERQQTENIKSLLNEKLYTKKDILKLFDRINSLAQAQNLKIIDITPPVDELLLLNKQVSDTTQPLYLNITLKIEGRYIDFGQFTHKMETSLFYRQTNICQIAKNRENRNLSFSYGFKALLGNIEG